jgi:Ni/Co efflux regulator RcnB
MRKFVTALLAASTLAAPALASPAMAATGHDWNRSSQHATAQRHDDHSRYDQRRDNDRRADYRSWRKGDRFDHRYAQSYRVITNPRHYHLTNAPRGYRWVQSGHDAVLIGASSGLVIYVMNHVFR